MKKILKYITKHKVIAGIIIVVVIALGYYTYSKIKGTTVATQYVFGKVVKGDLVVSVSGTGQVSTLSKVEIKPQTTGQSQTLGQIVQVNVVNGQTVKAGDVIAVIDGKTALQSLNQAKASVASAQASYNKLVNGATDSDLQGNRASVQSAEISLKNSLQNLSTKLQSAYITISNSVLLNTDPFFNNPTIDPILNVTDTYFTDTDMEKRVNNTRFDIGNIMRDLKKSADAVMTSADPVAVVNDAITKIAKVRDYFDEMTILFVSNANSVSTAGDSALNSAKSSASSARTSANSAVSDMVSALQSYQNAVVSLDQAKTSLAFKQAPANYTDIVVVQAQLDNANSNLANAYETYNSRIVKAPFDGQIGGLNAQIGQQVTSSEVLGTIITPQKVVNISLNEVDAAKVKAGDIVSLTFDAFPDLKINGKVSFVDPLGTVTQGVVNYSVQITMDDQNDQIKTGMTATAYIATETHPNVLMVPESAVTKVKNKATVLMPVSSSNSETQVTAVPVTVGISNDMMTEIISGLNEGDRIVTRTITGTTAKTSTAKTGSIFGVGGATGGSRTTGR